MSLKYQTLEWDSNFFGFNVAKVIVTDVERVSLRETLDDLRLNRYRLVVLHVPVNIKDISDIVAKNGGNLVDTKVTYAKNIVSRAAVKDEFPYVAKFYSEQEPSSDLVSLALQSSCYSRFRRDPIFPSPLCDKLYTRWIERSVKKEIASQVLVVEKENHLLGMVTMAERDGYGDIGLLATMVNVRGKGIGRLLLSSAEAYFLSQGLARVKVVTQEINKAACNLYRLNGYSVENVENVFHFWL
jgi:dTDP-4-amino-4,6-dideoxy-D-galactose acyltransferase